MGLRLKETQLRYRIVERHPRVGDSWRNRYASLVLFTPRSYSALPGLAVPGDPEGFPTKDEMADYLEAYVEHFDLRVVPGTGSRRIERVDGGFRATTESGEPIDSRAVAFATGAFQRPAIPPISKRLSTVAYPGLTLLDVVGPMTAFMGLTRGLVSTSREYSTVLVAERVEPVDSNTPMALIPDKAFEEVPDPFALVPGGGVHALKAMGNERLVNYLRFASYGAELVGSVSTGAFVLAAAGLLESRRATTHWAFYKLLEQFGATYVRKRWVQDGKFICSAGVSAEIDMSLQLTARLTDERTSREVQYRLGYDPEPPFGGIDYERIGGQLGAWRAGLSLADPVIAAKPKRLTKQNR